MLSDNDIIRLLGKDIIIHPFNHDYIEGGNIYLTASELAWSYKTKTKIVQDTRDNKIIKIPANDTGLIVTQEILEISQNIAATGHSRVALLSKGLGHISTPIKPGMKGNLLIVLHNTTDNEIEIKVGDRIVVVMFHELKTKAERAAKDLTIVDRLKNAGIIIALDSSDDKILKQFESVEFHNEAREACDALRKKSQSRSFFNWLKPYMSYAATITALFLQIYFLFTAQNLQFREGLYITTAITGTILGVLIGKEPGKG